MAACEQACEHAIDHFLLADDDLANLVTNFFDLVGCELNRGFRLHVLFYLRFEIGSRRGLGGQNPTCESCRPPDTKASGRECTPINVSPWMLCSKCAVSP